MDIDSRDRHKREKDTLRICYLEIKDQLNVDDKVLDVLYASRIITTAKKRDLGRAEKPREDKVYSHNVISCINIVQ